MGGPLRARSTRRRDSGVLERAMTWSDHIDLEEPPESEFVEGPVSRLGQMTEMARLLLDRPGRLAGRVTAALLAQVRYGAGLVWPIALLGVVAVAVAVVAVTPGTVDAPLEPTRDVQVTEQEPTAAPIAESAPTRAPHGPTGLTIGPVAGSAARRPASFDERDGADSLFDGWTLPSYPQPPASPAEAEGTNPAQSRD